jgi:biopolymer transport protein ExbB/TolQ
MDNILKTAFNPLLQYGVLGINTIVFAVVIWALWKAGNAERTSLLARIASLQDLRVAGENTIQEARILDHTKMQATLLEVSKQSTMAVAAATAAVEAIRETMLETKSTIKDLRDELRNHRS